MKRKSQNASPVAVAGDPWATVAETSRTHVAAANDCATAMFRGFEAIRKVQEDAAHRAAERHAAATAKLHGGCAPAELASLQGELLRSDLEGATQYWKALFAAACEMQSQMAMSYSQLVDAEALFEATSALSSMAKAFPPSAIAR